jgi:peptide/nickel transport system permease protein
MNTEVTTTTGTPVRVSESRRFLRVLLSRRGVSFGLVIISILIIVAIFAPLLAPYGPYETDPRNALQGPTVLHIF